MSKIVYTPFIKDIIRNDPTEIILPKSEPIGGYIPEYDLTEIEKPSFPEIPELPSQEEIIPKLGNIDTGNIDIGKMQPLIDKFKQHNISFRVTSGYRPGSMTKSGNRSFHSEGRALDIVPIPGETFKDLEKQIGDKPDLVKWMLDNDYGILDETTSEMMKRTGATGAHWHIGSDKSALEGLRKMFKLQDGGKIERKKNLLEAKRSSINDINTWLSARSDIFKNNFKEYKGNTLSQSRRLMQTTGIFDNSNWDKENGYQRKNYGNYKTMWYDDVKNSYGFYNKDLHISGIQDFDKNIPRYGTVIHEMTHSGNYQPQIKKIGDFLKLKDSGEYDIYLDVPEEVYSRLMNIRITNKLDPKKRWTLDDINRLKRDLNTKDDNILNRYTDESLLQLFNDVAYIPEKVQYAQSGGKIELPVYSGYKNDVNKTYYKYPVYNRRKYEGSSEKKETYGYEPVYHLNENYEIIPEYQESERPMFQTLKDMNLYGINVDNAEYIYDQLIKKYSPEQSTAILSQLIAESEVDPHRYQNNGPAIGLLQWEKPRQEQYLKFASTLPDQDEVDPELYRQTQFLIHELENNTNQWLSGGGRKSTEHLEIFKSSNNPEELIHSLIYSFIRPKNKQADYDKRLKIYNILKPKKAV